MIVDAHHHLWDTARRDYAWMSGPYARLRGAFLAGELSRVVRPLGVTATVAVQAATSERETTELLALAADPTAIVAGVVGWVDLTGPDPAGRIAALREGLGGERLVGIRHPVHDEADPDWLLRADVLAGLRAVADAGLAYDLLLRPVHLPHATALAQRMPQLRLVLDHGAKPEIAHGGWEPWSRDLARLAAQENVRCKLSGLVTEADWTAWNGEQIGRYGDRLLELFGPRRLLFGSDWPVCTLAASYPEVLALAHATLDGLTPAERTAVLGASAVETYGLEPLLGRWGGG